MKLFICGLFYIFSRNQWEPMTDRKSDNNDNYNIYLCSTFKNRVTKCFTNKMNKYNTHQNKTKNKSSYSKQHVYENEFSVAI